MLNQANVSLPMQVWLVDDTYSGKSESEKTISVTTLLKPIRQIILSQRASKSEPEDVIDNVAKATGTAIHAGIQNAWSDRYAQNLQKLGYKQNFIDRVKINPETVSESDIPVYIEKRVEKEILGWKVTGQFDMVFNGQLIDFKTTSCMTWISGSKTEDYILQGSMYRWLNPEIIKEDTIAINFLFKDWSASKTMEKDYPPASIFEHKYPLWDGPQTVSYIMDKLSRLDEYYNQEEANLPRCTSIEVGMTPSKWAYYANPDSKRATKVFDLLADATQEQVSRGKGIIKERKGCPRLCKYCAGCILCSQYQEYVQQGLL